jgi:hypothetical protein
VRFLGRRVYAGLVVVLITAMIHGLKPARVRHIRETLQIDSRTLKRWRQWWLDNFVRSSFWKAARARFMPPVCEQTLPMSLWLSFELQERPPSAGCLTVPEANNHPHSLEGACYVRFFRTPAEDAGGLNSGSGGRSRTSPPASSLLNCSKEKRECERKRRSSSEISSWCASILIPKTA